MTPKKLEEIRARLLSDPYTSNIAKTIGVPLKEYVEKVLYYAQNPDAQPELQLISDEDAKRQGLATVDEVKQWFVDVQDGKIDLRPDHEKDSFEKSQKRPVSLKD